MAAMEDLAAIAIDVYGVRILRLAGEGPLIANERDAADIMGGVFSQRAHMVAIPVGRLVSDFFVLRTRIAGEVIQKFVTYDIRVAILGDISGPLAASSALRDFVTESNRGKQVWFLADIDELHRRLAAA
jgi:hypothetical protein